MMKTQSQRKSFFPRIFEKIKASSNPSISNIKLDVMIDILLSLSEKDLSYIKSIQNDSCYRCGMCCRTSKYIRYEYEDIGRISFHKKISIQDFIKKYGALEYEGTYLITGVPCSFLKGKNECEIYEIRPKVCREFPMGYSIMRLRKRQSPFPSFCQAIDDLVVKLVMLRARASVNVFLT